VNFTGYCFGDGYRELGSNAYAFVESSGVGGTHPALLEAMGMGNCVVVNGTAENLETIGSAGMSYREPTDEASASALGAILQQLVDDPALVEDYRQKAQHRARTEYTWDKVTDRYELLFSRLLRKVRSPKPRAQRSASRRPAPEVRGPESL
jgi:glycosyltransferase involved in cell wall biosynthesis